MGKKIARNVRISGRGIRNMRIRNILLLVVLLLLILATLLLAGRANAAALSEPLNPMAYMIAGKFSAVSESQVGLDGTEVLGAPVIVQGKSVQQSAAVVPDGSHTMQLSGGTPVTVTTADLNLGKTYQNAQLGVTISDNGQDWGRTGVVVFPAEGGKIILSISGLGYSSTLPEPKEFWDGSAWTATPNWGFFTVVRVSVPVIPLEPQDPNAFMVDGKFSVVSANPAKLDGEALTASLFKNGRDLKQTAGIVVDGVHSLMAGGIAPWSVTTADLTLKSFQDSKLGVTVTATAASGRVGVVIFPSANGKIVITVTGQGYDSAFPAGTESWDGSKWASSVTWGYYTILRVKAPVVMQSFYLPLMLQTSGGTPVVKCADAAPFQPIYWQLFTGLGICNTTQPDPINGITATALMNSNYANWQYLGHVPGWIPQGASYTGTLLTFKANAGPIGVFEHPGAVVSHSPVFAAVYTVTGGGYETVQKDWADKLWYWDFSTKTWSTTPKWGNNMVIAVENK